jgi:hypothetical protein
MPALKLERQKIAHLFSLYNKKLQNAPLSAFFPAQQSDNNVVTKPYMKISEHFHPSAQCGYPMNVFIVKLIPAFV